jgi:DNA-binding NarL/FixJ family response regulator
LKEGRLKPVAEALDLSIHTVKSQKEAIMRKLGATNAIELTLSAIKRGLVEIEPNKEINDEEQI